MVSALMTARKAKEVYKFDSIKSHGNTIELRNTNGKPVVVQADQLVYMRGKGNFGIYGDMRDAHRKSTGYSPSSHAGKVGTSQTHRHETRQTEMTMLELTWELKCHPITTRKKLRELIADGRIIENIVGNGKHRPLRTYSMPPGTPINHYIEE